MRGCTDSQERRQIDAKHMEGHQRPGDHHRPGAHAAERQHDLSPGAASGTGEQDPHHMQPYTQAVRRISRRDGRARVQVMGQAPREQDPHHTQPCTQAVHCTSADMVHRWSARVEAVRRALTHAWMSGRRCTCSKALSLMLSVRMSCTLLRSIPDTM